MSHRPQSPYENGFLILLIILAISGLIWLFHPFLQALFFAAIVATATYPAYESLLPKFKGEANRTSLAMVAGVIVILIAPLTYLLTVASIETGQAYGKIHQWLSHQNKESLLTFNSQIMHHIGLSQELQQQLLQQLQQNAESLIKFAQDAILSLVQTVIGSTTSFITFISLALFALFFFYRDGHAIAHHLKVLSPLENVYDTFLMQRFSQLSGTLLLSILGVAVMQGVTFALLAWTLGLPGLFIGMAVAITSFIPVVGLALVWVPLAIYSVFQGAYFHAGVISFFGVVVNGFLIDNIARPILMQKISTLFSSHLTPSQVTSHTLLTVLSTFAGLLQFGILGLFFGPVIAAMAIAIFEVYERKNTDLLDRS